MELTKNQKIVATLLDKAWDHPEFIPELIANPEETIKNTTGKNLDIAEGKRLVIVDQTDTDVVYLNIPARPNLDEIELTDEQLEMIAGGLTEAEMLAGSAGTGVGG